jgi:nitroreductase
VQNSKVTERLDHVDRYAVEPEYRNGLTPGIAILIVLLVLAALWRALGGITIDTTLSIIVKVPAWMMFLGATAVFIGAVFIGRYMREEL